MKFDIGRNNDELLKTIWEHKKGKKNWSSLVAMQSLSISRPSISQTIIQQNNQFESSHRFAFYGSKFKQNHEKMMELCNMGQRIWMQDE
jgi:hypothetical protein